MDVALLCDGMPRCVFVVTQCVGLPSITGGNNYLVRRFQNYFLKCRIHLFPNVGGQKHLVRDTRGQRGLRIERRLQGRQ